MTRSRLPLVALLSVSLLACGGDPRVGDDPDGGRARTDAHAPPADGSVADAPLAELDAGGSSGERGGPVRIEGRVLVDDGGPFVGLGATLFWAAWAYRNDRPRLERNLAWLRDHGFHYIRALGLVGDPAGEDYWDGREIELGWSDYDEVIAGLTDLAWDGYGLRVEWTLIGDGQVSIPEEADRYELVDRFLAMSETRREKILHFEIANEAWQNGFSGDEGHAQLRALSVYMRDRTDIPVAASAPYDSGNCDVVRDLYRGVGEIADLATLHFDRDLGREEGGWGPVWQPWTLAECDAWVGSNNEPIGPGASVSSENDPTRLAASALATWIAGLPLYVFHSNAGVRGDADIGAMPGADAFQHVVSLVPPDVSGWERRRGDESDAPIRFFAEDAAGALIADTTWMDVAEPPRSGVVRGYGAVRGDEFVVLPIGVLGSVTIEARRAIAFEVFEVVGGTRLAEHSLDAGERVVLTGAEAMVLRGRSR